ncbi:3-oxoacyl-ACP reductase [Mycolicibacterium madagascariense]|uniref:3-oxoacyl-[acyl-carrier-protein] reductase MabA n=1 Tax=Mycolicibacterium madagascariense TaxID=212765 RepID=A0A7I7XC82_9MYCO|nr:SDR family oxidoreductase [Mycolicibacterium madagascariense]MCV7013602.1 SDR family oxidoreductase [Mycolicibacterium madagascariense]BBZ27052.1 3-oxoacyl-ACP reductase [Mycolicibacterium madagascariense]
MSRNAIVTGSASGIGLAVTELLRAQGWTVTGIDLSEAADHVADVSDPAAVSAAITAIQSSTGDVDALVTAAGHYERSPISQISPAALHRMLRVHVGGLRNAARAVLPSMLARGSGAIVAVTSELAIGGGDEDAHYAAAKGAIIGLVRSLAAELAGRGVRVNAVAPGPTDTPLLAADSPWRATEYLATLPNRRLTTPQEVARVVEFLADASYCTGEIISPNGGAVI